MLYVISRNIAGQETDFQIGDIIEQIDGEPPSKHFTVSSYHSIEQVKK